MKDLNYIHWEDYYKDTWIKKYKYIKKNIGSCNYNDFKQKKLLLREFVLFFNSTCWLLRYYLGNNGLYYDTNMRVIRGAFRYDFINDGDNWLMMYDNLINYKNIGIDYVINFCTKEHFNLIEELKDKFNNLLEK